MAKKYKRMMALVMALVLSIAQIATPAKAWSFPGYNDPADANKFEWYEVRVQGTTVEYQAGPLGDYYFMGTSYSVQTSVDGAILSYAIVPVQGSQGNFYGSVDLTQYITIPEGYSVEDLEVIDNISGVNDAVFEKFDNAIISITVKTLQNEETGEIHQLSKVTVNHNYYTYDAYTGNTSLDATVPSSMDIMDGQSYTASTIPSYNGNSYEVTSISPDLTITVTKDPSSNVINIDYLRQIDTTPAPVETSVTVNHSYFVYDVYTEETTSEGSSSASFDSVEGASFTASAATSFGGNTYEVDEVSPAMTIDVVADASQNVINIRYVRQIDTTPKATSVTVNHNYFVYDVYTGETTSEGSDSQTFDATEFDSFTASAVTSFGGNTYEIDEVSPAMTIDVVADASRNVITINYIRQIDTTPKATTVTVYHYYRTWDKYTDETTDDGQFVETFNATEFDSFTATPILTYGGNNYQRFTNDALLTIDVVADPAENEVIISYTRTVDTSPKATTVTVNHHYATKDVYTGVTTDDGSVSIVSNATEYETFEAAEITQYNGLDYNRTTHLDDLVITVKANAEKNVIDIDYLRIIDTTPIDYEPVVSIEKSADKVSYQLGDTITWTITVTNTSQHTAYDIVIIDELLDKTWTIDALAPGASESFTASAKAEKAGALKNVAVVDWNDNDEVDDRDEPDEITTASDDVTVVVEEPAPAPVNPIADEDDNEPAPAPQPEAQPEAEAEIEEEPVPAAPAAVTPVIGNAFVDIMDEDVPLADVPQTGDSSLLWALMSLLTGGSAMMLAKKKED